MAPGSIPTRAEIPAGGVLETLTQPSLAFQDARPGGPFPIFFTGFDCLAMPSGLDPTLWQPHAGTWTPRPETPRAQMQQLGALHAGVQVGVKHFMALTACLQRLRLLATALFRTPYNRHT